ncbi:mating-type protein MAT alpha 1-domain-containing protein, partial [Lasiosphaeria hispida]
MQTFADLDDSDRLMRALSTMMGATPTMATAPTTPTKKVNGFIGYRSYYSALFSHLPRKEHSPIVTKLWQADPRQREWNFLCGVYSKIRAPLAEESIRLKQWIAFAVKPLGIVERERYMAAMGWSVTEVDGTHRVERSAPILDMPNIPPMTEFDLFMCCMTGGLPVEDSKPVVAALGGVTPAMYINTMSTDSDVNTNITTTDAVNNLVRLMRSDPGLAMCKL